MTDVLSTPMQDNDADAKTVGEYLLALARQVWIEDEGFSGKRPFGNSDWKSDVYGALVRGGVVEGELMDDYDEIAWDTFDEEAADKLILAALASLAPSKPTMADVNRAALIDAAAGAIHGGDYAHCPQVEREHYIAAATCAVDAVLPLIEQAIAAQAGSGEFREAVELIVAAALVRSYMGSEQ